LVLHERYAFSDPSRTDLIAMLFEDERSVIIGFRASLGVGCFMVEVAGQEGRNRSKVSGRSACTSYERSAAP
jgi:hypothetical protein